MRSWVSAAGQISSNGALTRRRAGLTIDFWMRRNYAERFISAQGTTVENILIQWLWFNGCFFLLFLHPSVSPNLLFASVFSSSTLPFLVILFYVPGDWRFFVFPGSWARWQCWRSGRSWWRESWSPEPSARRAPTRSGSAKTGHGPRCWWTTCCPATTTDTFSFHKSGPLRRDRSIFNY